MDSGPRRMTIVTIAKVRRRRSTRTRGAGNRSSSREIHHHRALAGQDTVGTTEARAVCMSSHCCSRSKAVAAGRERILAVHDASQSMSEADSDGPDGPDM